MTAWLNAHPNIAGCFGILVGVVLVVGLMLLADKVTRDCDR